MNDNKNNFNDTIADSSSCNVSLIIDYDNGKQKNFNIRWVPGMDIVDLLDRASITKPGFKFGFSKEFIDRGGNDVYIIGSIDDVAVESKDQMWLLQVNEKNIGQEIKLKTAISTGRWNIGIINEGDIVTLKFSNN